MLRTVLTTPTDFYFNSSGGSLGNDGLSPGSPLPTAQDVANLLYSSYDLGSQQVQVHDVAGNVDPGFRLSGLMVGQRGGAALHSSSRALSARPAAARALLWTASQCAPSTT
jgi:hypothetical protein